MEEETNYYVVRDYSGVTAHKTLWQVMSRPLADLQTAKQWLKYFKDLDTTGRSFRIVMEVS